MVLQEWTGNLFTNGKSYSFLMSCLLPFRKGSKLQTSKLFKICCCGVLEPLGCCQVPLEKMNATSNPAGARFFFEGCGLSYVLGQNSGCSKKFQKQIIMSNVKYMTADRTIHKHFILKIHLKHSQGCFLYISMFHAFEISDDGWMYVWVFLEGDSVF